MTPLSSAAFLRPGLNGLFELFLRAPEKRARVKKRVVKAGSGAQIK